jgi:hypothetical protein
MTMRETIPRSAILCPAGLSSPQTGMKKPRRRYATGASLGVSKRSQSHATEDRLRERIIAHSLAKGSAGRPAPKSLQAEKPAG